MVTLGGFVLLIPLSPVLIFGWGPFPQLGVAGGGAAVLIYYLLAMLVLGLYMRSPQSPLALRIAPLRWRLFKDMLGVGLLSALGSIQLNLTVVFVTAAVGLFGADAIAGYGIASRLDYIQIPILFGIGTALLTMVGVNIGAGQLDRARRIAWTGAVVSFVVTELIGVTALLFPHAWIGLFSDDPDVHAMAALYIRNVAPVYGFVGLGLALYFASQGAGRVLLPVLAGTARMIIAAFVGWLAVAWYGVGLSTLFLIVGCASVTYGAIVAATMLLGAWGHPARWQM
ncbi:MATE family efflux transporter [Sulfitobacter porphyrae]|uniref:MATE family efflux transporter n=1 Tax=Sulfitobacter porphyrae TaxID=1246864 RepID=A0ABW2B6U1_9RHOB